MPSGKCRSAYAGEMSEQSVTTLTVAEYLAWEVYQPERYELVGGRVYAMTGGTERHGLMAGRLFTLLAAGAVAKRCRAFHSDRKLQVATGDVYYPDVMVVCGKAADVQYEADATIVVEVLSPSTRSQDRREKVRSYSTLPLIKRYVVVEPDVRRIEVAHWDAGRRLAWTTLGPGDQLHTPYGTWNVDDIHDTVDSLATT
jgi:Uma2 family endonuclease